MQKFSPEEIRTSVRDSYGRVAQGQGRECGCATSCCTPAQGYCANEVSRACVGGASPVDELAATIEAAGFTAIRIEPRDEGGDFSRVKDPVVSATIQAVKP